MTKVDFLRRWINPKLYAKLFSGFEAFFEIFSVNTIGNTFCKQIFDFSCVGRNHNYFLKNIHSVYKFF